MEAWLFIYFCCFFSPPHVKCEPNDDFYHSPKHEKSLKRERDDDEEWVPSEHLNVPFIIVYNLCGPSAHLVLFNAQCCSYDFKSKKVKTENDKKDKKRKQMEVSEVHPLVCKNSNFVFYEYGASMKNMSNIILRFHQRYSTL